MVPSKYSLGFARSRSTEPITEHIEQFVFWLKLVILIPSGAIPFWLEWRFFGRACGSTEGIIPYMHKEWPAGLFIGAQALLLVLPLLANYLYIRAVYLHVRGGRSRWYYILILPLLPALYMSVVLASLFVLWGGGCLRWQ